MLSCENRMSLMIKALVDFGGVVGNHEAIIKGDVFCFMIFLRFF